MDTSKVNRVEVIDHTRPIEDGGGHAYVFWEDEVEDRSPYDETLNDIIKNSTVVVSEIW